MNKKEKKEIIDKVIKKEKRFKGEEKSKKELIIKRRQ